MTSDWLRWAAWGWLLLVLTAGGWLGAGWLNQPPKLSTDILAMLPQDSTSKVSEQALARMAEQGERQLLVVIGGQTAEQTRQAADAYIAQLASAPVSIRHRLSESELQAFRAFFASKRQLLLTDAHRAALHPFNPDYWQHQAWQQLQTPVAQGLSWQQDPFGLFGDWLSSRQSGLKLSLNQQRLWLEAAGQHWAVVLLHLHGNPMALDEQQRLLPALAQARQQLLEQFPNVELRQSGLVLYAAAAAEQAEQEISSIGLISTVAILLLLILVFRSLHALLLAWLPMLVGTLLAVVSCLWLFEHLHLITLVFGASLLGVAVDYSLHCLAAYLGPLNRLSARDCLAKLNPGMTLAMWTTVIAYMGLALTPFPGLRQMALFASVGLIGAWATVVLWYPFISPKLTPRPRLLSRFAALYHWFPGWQQRRYRGLVLLLICLPLVGLLKLAPRDDVRALQSPPAGLLADQMRIQQLLALPSPGQFFIVQADSPQQLLEREQLLTPALHGLIQQGLLSSYQALSDQIPSLSRQQQNLDDQQRLYQPDGPLAALAEQLGAAPDWFAQLSHRPELLNFDDWLAAPVSEPWRHLWLGQIDGRATSLISLTGVKPESLAPLARLAQTDVLWLDKPGQISQLLQHYRELMSGVIAVSYLLIFAVLWHRYRQQSWRIILPTLLATGLTLAVLGWLQQPLQLFTVLALFIVLGIGVDFGIFLLEETQHDDTSAALTVSLSALTTLLSFGLLAWSGNPALKAFGLTNLLGLSFCWLLTAACAPPPTSEVQ